MNYIQTSCFLLYMMISLSDCQIKVLQPDDDQDPVKHSDGLPLTDSSSFMTDASPGRFICPGVGNYALKKTGGDRCSKFYDCPKAQVKPASVRKCSGGKMFNRLSRSCVRRKYVECNWCKVEGRHVDITSSKHFIECVAGSIALRYRCKKGKYESSKESCESTDWTVMDVTVDALLDPPEDIEEFQKKWAQKIKKGQTSTLESTGKEQTEKSDDDGDEDEDEGGSDSNSKKKTSRGGNGKKKDGRINLGAQGAV